MQQERSEDAIGVLDEARLVHPLILAGLALSYGAAGRIAEAREALDVLIDLGSEQYVRATDVAMIYAALGDADRAIAWLEEAFDARAADLVFLNVAPEFDNLRDDPRFAELVRRMGFPG